MIRLPLLRPPLLRVFAAAAIVCLYGLAALAENITIDPANSHVAFTVADNLHTVHGTFQIKAGTLLIDSTTQKASGNLIVDVRSGNSGSHARDSRMHKDILESEKYPLSTFTPQTVEGTLSATGDSLLKIHGLFNIHGTDHPLTLDVTVHHEGEALQAKTSFELPYVSWGMKDPSNFLFHMEKSVKMDIELHGTIQH